jgi:hypothetical protein
VKQSSRAERFGCVGGPRPLVAVAEERAAARCEDRQAGAVLDPPNQELLLSSGHQEALCAAVQGAQWRGLLSSGDWDRLEAEALSKPDTRSEDDKLFDDECTALGVAPFDETPRPYREAAERRVWASTEGRLPGTKPFIGEPRARPGTRPRGAGRPRPRRSTSSSRGSPDADDDGPGPARRQSDDDAVADTRQAQPEAGAAHATPTERRPSVERGVYYLSRERRETWQRFIAISREGRSENEAARLRETAGRLALAQIAARRSARG